MSITATTLVTVMRGTATNAYGDEIDTDEVVDTHVRASILEKPATGGRPASGRADTPRGYTLRMWRNVGLQQNDRITDERTGEVYYVTTEVTPKGSVGLGSVRADLQRVT